ncbi:MAG: copper chaperone PCu(A)C [Gallionellaceae bacterium]|nr:copper chaperone PCu(A)C [Gallionellaceae bacterium]
MRYAIAMAALLCAAQVWAEEVTVSDAWARATVPGQEAAALQFSITSQKEAQLVAISSPAAGDVEIHSMTHDNGVMKMRAIESLALPAGKMVDLGASGNHVMLNSLKQPLKAGESIPFTVTVQFADKRRATVKAKAEVKPQPESHGEHEHHH